MFASDATPFCQRGGPLWMRALSGSENVVQLTEAQRCDWARAAEENREPGVVGETSVFVAGCPICFHLGGVGGGRFQVTYVRPPTCDRWSQVNEPKANRKGLSTDAADSALIGGQALPERAEQDYSGGRTVAFSSRTSEIFPPSETFPQKRAVVRPTFVVRSEQVTGDAKKCEVAPDGAKDCVVALVLVKLKA